MNSIVDNQPSVPEAVSWSEGMLLSPQHFQQNDIYWNALLRHHLSVLQPRFSGLLDLALDPTELVKGRVLVDRLHAVMGDGLLIEYPGHFAPQSLMLDLTGHDWTAEPFVTVHLRVPQRGKGAASDMLDMQRYTTEPGELMADENTGKDELAVDRLRPKMSLAPGNAIAKCYCSFPLFQLHGDSRGVRLTDYHPPLLRLEASDFLGPNALHVQLKKLSASLWAKYRELMGLGSDGQQELRHAGEAQAQTQAARLLVTAMPGLDVLLHSGQAHPFDLYRALAQLVGVVAGTAGAPQPPAMAGYDHNDCMPQFHRALVYVREQLARLNASYHVIEFRQRGAAGFTCSLPAGVNVDRLLIELRPRAGQTAATLGRWIDSAHIATDDLVPTLVRRRYPGATVKAASAPQVAAMNLRPGALVYQVGNGQIELDNGPSRPLLAAGRNLMIMGEPDDQVPAAITLYLPRSGSEGNA